MTEILAIIPARGGSVGVPRKNVLPLGGKPLIAGTIETLLESGVIHRVVVATEDAEIADVARGHGADVVTLPPEIAEGLTESAMLYVVGELKTQGYAPEYVALAQCTSPFLSADIVRDAVSRVTDGSFDSCITVFKPGGYEFKWRKATDGSFVPEHDVDNRPRRQDLDIPYHENGAFYITRADLFCSSRNRFGGKGARVAGVEMSEEDSLQIDSSLHWWMAEQLLIRKQGECRY